MSISSNMSINSRQNGANGRKKNSGHLEPSTVNPQVVGSSPTRGAKTAHICERFFLFTDPLFPANEGMMWAELCKPNRDGKGSERFYGS